VAQTVGALSYSRNNTGSIPGRTKNFLYLEFMFVQFSPHHLVGVGCGGGWVGGVVMMACVG